MANMDEVPLSNRQQKLLYLSLEENMPGVTCHGPKLTINLKVLNVWLTRDQVVVDLVCFFARLSATWSSRQREGRLPAA